MSVGAEVADWANGYMHARVWRFGCSGWCRTEIGRSEEKDNLIEYYGIDTLPNPKKQ